MSKAEKPDAASAAGETPERIAKVLARAGLCSRREAERWIADGRVAVDGKVLDSPAFNVTPDSVVTIDGNPLPAKEKPRLFRYHKPRGLIVTARDPQGRTTIFEKLPAGMPRVVSVGRLDLDSEGLLLLTNDGSLARHLELPSTGWVRRYRVRVFGTPDAKRLAALSGGTTIDGVAYGPIEVTIESEKGRNAWLSVSLREGQNREIRRVLEPIGLTVNRLIRTAYGPFQLGNLDRGLVDEVSPKVVREQLGTALKSDKKDAHHRR